jgi:hypothetical protein
LEENGAARREESTPGLGSDVNGDSRNHEDCAEPEAPVTMHTPPVRTRGSLATIAAISFEIVFASGHLISNPE